MTQDHGISRENHGEDRTFQLLSKGQSLQLVAPFEISGDREISGVAHVPVVDRETEIILSEAIRGALPDYMQLPILHVQHTERPIGTVTKAWVDDEGKFHLLGKIKETPDTDDVWEDIKKGTLNKFSIFGKRTQSTPECSISPSWRTTPCITKAMHLFSISVVGDNAMNQETFLRVAKAYENGGGSTPEEEEKKEESVEKGDELIRDPSNLSSIMERIDGIEKCSGEMKKSIAALYEMANPVEKSEGEDDMEDEEKKKDETVEKAAPEVKAETPEKDANVSPDYVMKAELSQYITKAELDTITKANDEIKKAYDELKVRVDKMEKETIEKGGHVVVVQNKYLDGKIGNIGNLDAIGA